MHIGVSIFPTDQTIQPLDLGPAVEDLGFESLWFPEHSHIPASRVTPWGGVKGAPPLPEEYWRTHDQFVAFGAVAAVTSTSYCWPPFITVNFVPICTSYLRSKRSMGI